MERALYFNKPCALLLPATWLNDNGIIKAYGDKQVQLLIPDARTAFIGNSNQPTFKAIYYCWDFLDRDIEFCHIDKQKKRKIKPI